MSGITLIRRFEKAPETPESDDAFVQGVSKIIPTLNDTVPGGKGAVLSLYFVVYPERTSTDVPKLLIEFLKDGKLITRGAPDLPKPDARGVIPYVANSPIEGLDGGQYEIRLTALQGGKAAQQSTFVTIEAPVR